MINGGHRDQLGDYYQVTLGHTIMTDIWLCPRIKAIVKLSEGSFSTGRAAGIKKIANKKVKASSVEDLLITGNGRT